MESTYRCRCAVLLFAMVAFGGFALAAADEESQLHAQAERTDQIAASGATAVGDKLAAEFTSFAGSSANAAALIDGLRNGTPVTLTNDASSASFTPATGKMGWGSVFIALSLAQAELKAAGIAAPTPQQIAAALNGGVVTTADGKTATLSGILTQRAAGMGWGAIANSAGLKLGPIIARIRSGNDRLDRLATRDRAGKPPSPPDIVHGRPDKPERPHRPDRPERPGKS